VGIRSDAITTERKQRNENSGKFEPVCYTAVVAKDIDRQGMGVERTVSILLMCIKFCICF